MAPRRTATPGARLSYLLRCLAREELLVADLEEPRVRLQSLLVGDRHEALAVEVLDSVEKHGAIAFGQNVLAHLDGQARSDADHRSHGPGCQHQC